MPTKQRFSSLDVKVIAHELSKSLVPLRVTNIYDLSSRIFLIKFHKPDHREQLIVDVGFRCHLTSYARTTASEPSDFVKRLRKFLKTRRVTSIRQIGTDRIIEFTFSDGLYKLFLEFYAGGNIVLTDGELKVLALFRNVEEGAEHERLRLGLQYNLSLRQNYEGAPDLTKQRVKEALQKAVNKTQELQPGKKARKPGKDALRKAISASIPECPPLLVDHAFHVAKFDATLKPQEVLENDVQLDGVLSALLEAQKITGSILESDPVKGYILAKPNPALPDTAEGDQQGKSKYLYEDFHPFRPMQFENSDFTFLEFEGFNKCVDEFFSSLEGQKLESRLHERESAAKKKINQAHQEHANRIDGLKQAQALNVRKAESIQANIYRVEEAIAAVNGLIGQGMDWTEIARLIEREQSQGNPVARLIKLPLKLYENTITLLLEESSTEQAAEDDEGNETSSLSEDTDDEDEKPSRNKKPAPKQLVSQTLTIDINLGLTPWANATEYFDERRTQAKKEERTKEASSKALQSHEKKVAADLKKGLQQEKEVLRPVRRQHWFEKFIYFISSEGYLVLGGKDAQQNEIIYQRYLQKGDVYVHADLKGAVPLIIKNHENSLDAPIPPSTLSQAGHLSICTSEAWDSKAVMSAWWVPGDKVSKTAPTGDFLAPGLFHIAGKKNYLPPAQLIVGLGVLFEISEASKANHNKHRYVDTPANAEAVFDAPSEGKYEQADDSDENFPDAKVGSDSDDDFPDAKVDLDSDDSEVEGVGKRANPLQSNNAAVNSESEDEPEPSEATEMPAASTATATSQADAEDEAGSIADSEPSAISKSGAKRYLSARERRLLRQGRPLDDVTESSATPSTTNVSDDEGEATSPSVAPSTATTSRADSTRPLPRGKRGKAKKLATKYADQDEEDRALAMRLLGSQSGQQAAEAAAEEKRNKEQEAEANKQRRREQHLRAQAIGRAAEEARRKNLAEGSKTEDDGVDTETMKLQMKNLDALIGRPLPSDEILSAIPVCAPWSALSAYKYKVKLQPGALKRGKAVREILGKWDLVGKDPKALDKTSTDRERIWPKEIDLIRGWKEAEVVGVLPVAKVRVMMGGRAAAASLAKGKGSKGGKSRGGTNKEKKLKKQK